MRAGWSDGDRNAPTLARMVEDAGAAAIAVRAHRCAKLQRNRRLGSGCPHADKLTIPVFGSGDCTEPEHIVERMASGVEGVLVGRGVLRNPWILSQAADLAAGLTPRLVTLEDRGRFLLDYIDLLLSERIRDEGMPQSHDRWVINKVRALGSWYTKGLEGGSLLRTAINSAASLSALRDVISTFFFAACNPAGPVAIGRH